MSLRNMSHYIMSKEYVTNAFTFLCYFVLKTCVLLCPKITERLTSRPVFPLIKKLLKIKLDFTNDSFFRSSHEVDDIANLVRSRHLLFYLNTSIKN